MDFMNRIIGLVVALVVGGVIVGGLLIPSIEAMTETEKTLVNEGYYRMSEIISETDTTIEWDYTNPTVMSINGTEYAVNFPIGKEVSIVGTDSMIIRMYHPNTNYYTVQCYCKDGFIAALNSNMTITISNDTVTAFNGTSTKTETITQGYYIDPNGNWIMKDSDKGAFIHTTDSVMILAGITYYSGLGDTGIFATGTITDGLDFTYVPTSSAAHTVIFGDVTFNYSEASSYKNLVSLNSCVFDLTIDDTLKTATYSYFIVPYEITAELSQHMTAMEIAMIGVISLLGIVILVVVAANGIKNKY